MATSEASSPGAGLLIGDVARLCGVSTRAVRHYHSMGLLPEPHRDSSGYRRYATADVIALVRVARLRALGMPVPQIADRVREGSYGFGADELRRLADELGEEIARLTDLRERIVAAIGSGVLADPAMQLAKTLRDRGRLAAQAELAPGEAEAAQLLDALHPGGMAGVLDAAQELSDGATRTTLDALLQRYQALTPDSGPAEIDALAAEVAAVLPRPEHAPPPVDVAVMDKLLGDRLNAPQREFMIRLRRRLDAADA
jgi:DNA-binding transcriptional MerR regulator